MSDGLHFLSPRERLLYLRSQASLDRISTDDLLLLANAARERHFARGEIIVKGGAPLHEVHVLVQGKARWLEPGRRPEILEPSIGLGFFAYLTGEPSYVQVTAETDVLTLEIPTHALEHALERSFPLLSQNLEYLSREILRLRGGLPADPEDAPVVKRAEAPDRPLTYVDVLVLSCEELLMFRDNVEGLAKLCQEFKEVRLPAGEFLWREGDLADHWVLVIDGELTCSIESGDSVRVGATWGLGTMDSLASGRRAYTARTETELIAIRFDHEALVGVMEENFDVALGMARNLARVVIALRKQQASRLPTESLHSGPRVGPTPVTA